MTGVSVIQYYAPRIFESIGIDTSTTLGLQSGNSVIALIGEGLCIWFIDRLGRRGPFIWGNALSGLTFVIGTILIAVFPAETNNHNASRALVSMTWLVSSVSTQPICSLLTSYIVVQSGVFVMFGSSIMGGWLRPFLPTFESISNCILSDSRRDVQQRDAG